MQTFELRAPVEGFLEQVRFQEGALVQAGQLMFVIERLPYEAALQSATAQLAQAQADPTWAQEPVEVPRTREQLARDRTVPQQDMDIAVPAADVQVAEASLRNDERR